MSKNKYIAAFLARKGKGTKAPAKSSPAPTPRAPSVPPPPPSLDELFSDDELETMTAPSEEKKSKKDKKDKR